LEKREIFFTISHVTVGGTAAGGTLFQKRKVKEKEREKREI
jgi:hypothetical protein